MCFWLENHFLFSATCWLLLFIFRYFLENDNANLQNTINRGQRKPMKLKKFSGLRELKVILSTSLYVGMYSTSPSFELGKQLQNFANILFSKRYSNGQDIIICSLELAESEKEEPNLENN